jgi:hypothetical protein
MGGRFALGDTLIAAKDTVPRPLKTWSRQVFRTYGMATGAFRPLPDYIIVGTKRGGTTSLYRYLLQHPAVLPTFPSFQTLKGVRFFDEHFGKGFSWYRSHFPSASYRDMYERARQQRPIVGEASPGYLFHPLAAARVASSMPRAKIIALLRNPVDRAYSHYLDEVKLGVEPLSFEQAIDHEPVRLAGELERAITSPPYYSDALERYSYLTRGLYLPQLAAWMQAFPAEQLLILRSEDLANEPRRIHLEVLEFLGLPLIPLESYSRHNSRAGAEMNPSTRQRLAEYFGPHNEGLYERLGRNFCWDS